MSIGAGLWDSQRRLRFLLPAGVSPVDKVHRTAEPPGAPLWFPTANLVWWTPHWPKLPSWDLPAFPAREVEHGTTHLQRG
ncbi:unnamed protein product [Ixodes pacificus]